MSLERLDMETLREAQGFSFSMRITGTHENVRVFVADDALDDGMARGLAELRSQFDKDKQGFEDIASARHSHGRVAANGTVTITAADLFGIID